MTATAVGTYATKDNVKLRLGRAVSDTADDTLIQKYCDQVNARIETITGRVLAPITFTNALWDGYDALAGGRLLPIDIGIRTITTLEVALTTGGSFSTVPATDYFIRPAAQLRDPGWPGTELWMTDIPSASNTTPLFAPGYGNVRITGTGGWAASPDEIIDCAETVAVRAFQARRTGQGDVVGTSETGQAIISRILASEWMDLLRRYTAKDVMIV